MRSLDDGIEGCDLDPAGNIGCERVERDDAHAHRNADLGAAADGSQTNEPERASLQLQALVGGLVPMPVMHPVVELCDALGAGRIRAQVCSATASAFAPVAALTAIPRSAAAAVSMVSRPTPCLAITRSLALASMMRAETFP